MKGLLDIDLVPAYAILLYIITSIAVTGNLMRLKRHESHHTLATVFSHLAFSSFVAVLSYIFYATTWDLTDLDIKDVYNQYYSVSVGIIIALYAAQIALGWWMIKPITKKK